MNRREQLQRWIVTLDMRALMLGPPRHDLEADQLILAARSEDLAR